MKSGRKEHGHYNGGESFKLGLTSAEDLTIELSKGHESYYPKLDPCL